MKKSIFLVTCLLLSWYNYAALYVINNTDCNVNYTIFAHDAANPACGYYQSAPVLVSPPMSFATPASTFGAVSPTWYNAPNYSTLNPAPSSTPIWDYIKLFITDLPCSVYTSVGNNVYCAIVPAAYTSTCAPCAGSTQAINITWTAVGSNTVISFDY
jgi:hypothetical protein